MRSILDIRVSREFIEHGHLYGESALVVAFGDGIPASTLKREWMAPERLHFFIRTEAEAKAANALYDDLRALGVKRISACVPPSVSSHLCNALAYESVLRITDCDDAEHVGAASLDARMGSVSVHSWLGSPILDVLEANVEAPYGRFLVLAQEDIGQAKVWLSANRKPCWKIIPTYSLNRLEKAEFEEMSA